MYVSKWIVQALGAIIGAVVVVVAWTFGNRRGYYYGELHEWQRSTDARVD